MACWARSGRGVAGEEHPLHATLPLLVEVVGQPEAEPAVAALAARCACFIAALDPWSSAGEWLPNAFPRRILSARCL